MFKPCLKKPTGRNLYYIGKSAGGYSPCWPGNEKRQDPILDRLPNCVGWVTGRINETIHEMQGGSGIQFTVKGDAKDWIKNAKAKGYEVTLEPTLGGIMVWSGGNSNLGHVAFVEQKLSSSKVVTSESEYFGAVFKNFTRKNTDGNWRSGCSWMGANYKYLGCITNPAVKEEQSEMITDRKLKNLDTNQVVTVKGILKDNQNYIRLADLADMGVLNVSYDPQNNLACVGKKK